MDREDAGNLFESDPILQKLAARFGQTLALYRKRLEKHLGPLANEFMVGMTYSALYEGERLRIARERRERTEKGESGEVINMEAHKEILRVARLLRASGWDAHRLAREAFALGLEDLEDHFAITADTPLLGE